MIKSFILAATSIACILSLSNVAVAGNLHQDNYSKSKLNLVKSQTYISRSSYVPRKDLKDIDKAIAEFYKNKNKEPQAPSYSGATRFFEVKEISITSFTNDSATAKLSEAEQIYSFQGVSGQLTNGKYKYTYNKRSFEKPNVREFNIYLFKVDGKWIAK